MTRDDGDEKPGFPTGDLIAVIRDGVDETKAALAVRVLYPVGIRRHLYDEQASARSRQEVVSAVYRWRDRCDQDAAHFCVDTLSGLRPVGGHPRSALSDEFTFRDVQKTILDLVSDEEVLVGIAQQAATRWFDADLIPAVVGRLSDGARDTLAKAADSLVLRVSLVDAAGDEATAAKLRLTTPYYAELYASRLPALRRALTAVFEATDVRCHIEDEELLHRILWDTSKSLDARVEALQRLTGRTAAPGEADRDVAARPFCRGGNHHLGPDCVCTICGTTRHDFEVDRYEHASPPTAGVSSNQTYGTCVRCGAHSTWLTEDSW